MMKRRTNNFYLKLYDNNIKNENSKNFNSEKKNFYYNLNKNDELYKNSLKEMNERIYDGCNFDYKWSLINSEKKIKNKKSLLKSFTDFFQSFKKNDNKINNKNNNNNEFNNVDLIINVNFNNSDENAIFSIKNINLKNKVSLLKDLISKEIKKYLKNKYYLNIKIENLSLLFINNFLIDENDLIQYNLTSNSKINCFCSYKNENETFLTESSIKSNENIINNSNNSNENNFNENENNIENDDNNNDLVPVEKIPFLSKIGYKTNPDYIEICRMPKRELMNVKNFKIFNEFGEVEFLAPVNLIEVNLDEEINIEKYSIEINENPKLKKPKKCILKQFKLNGKDEIIEELKNQIKLNKGEFIKYDEIKGELIWEYKQ